MAYSGQHMLTVIGGSLFTNEQWSISFRSTPNFGDATQDTQAVVATIAEAIRAWFVASIYIGPAAKLGFVKHNRIGVDGKYVNNTTGEVLYGNLAAAASTGGHPPQIALALTLETGITRGLANRGRVFMPNPVGVIGGTTGTLTTGVATNHATSLASLFTTLNGLTGFGTVSVYSRGKAGPVLAGSKSPSFPNPGVARPVTGVSCGLVLDTIRSRRAQLVEARPPTVAVGGQ